ncbi:Crp/Fnr family transcriptional regulator [Rufibacter sp. LB8]|uniref:Crp/Fnr family transcriptional regulator n=1 Tax=Rufibacter sp. LB8 TaxID=2777781 RepID=UPI00178C207F
MAKKLFALAVHRKISKHDILLQEGQRCTSIFYLESGYLRSYITKDGAEINTNFTFGNSFLTNLKSLRLQVPSDITIKAGEDSSIYEFAQEKLLALYAESPEVESCGRMLAEHLLIEQEEHANLFKLSSPKERYHLLETEHPEILQRVSLTHLASYLGVARETLSRIRKPAAPLIL